MSISDYPKQVYAIQHNRTRRIYIGRSHDVATRYWSHIYLLRKGEHYNKAMQADFDKYGEDYGLFILDDIEDFNERQKEYEWMNKLRTTDPEIGYNFGEHATTKLRQTKPPFREGIPIPNEKGNSELDSRRAI